MFDASSLSLVFHTFGQSVEVTEVNLFGFKSEVSLSRVVTSRLREFHRRKGYKARRARFSGREVA